MFKDRADAGQLLAKELLHYKNKKEVLVLGIPRGGIVVAYEVAQALHAPLDIIVIKKLGFPGQEELALGAVGIDTYFLNEELSGGISDDYIKDHVKQKQQEVRKRYELFRGKKPMYSVKNKIVILVDDGIATGATMLMAVEILKKQKPNKIIVAIPVAPPDTVKKLKKIADEVICLDTPLLFMAIGQFYQDFQQVEDDEAKQYLGGFL